MKAELDTVNGQPVLRLEKSGGWAGGKRAVCDVPLTPEQARSITVQMGVVG